jgi:preprotein translocase subunit YajC
MIVHEVSNGSWQQMLPNILWLVLLFVVFYFLLVLPEQKRQKKLRKLHEGLKVGQRVYAGALVGTIKKIQEKTCIIHTADTDVEVLKMAIAYVEHNNNEEQVQPIS